MTLNKREKGTRGEDTAVDYLTKKGYRILARNFRFEYGEIDIIAEDGDCLVFVEVKARRSRSFGDPEDAVTERKQNQLRKTAEGYFLKNDIEDKECRFDIIAIEEDGKEVVIRHLTDAF